MPGRFEIASCLFRALRALLNELDLVAVRVLDTILSGTELCAQSAPEGRAPWMARVKGDDRAPVFHRPGLARPFSAAVFDFRAGFVGVGHFERNVAETAAKIVFPGTPVVGQLDDRMFGFWSVTDTIPPGAELGALCAPGGRAPWMAPVKGERELAVGVILPAQQLHSQHVGI